MSVPTIHEWKNLGQTVELLGHNIFYIDTAETHKSVVVLIHGFPTSSWDWSKVWPILSKSYRLICMDMLGFGYSDKPKHHHYTMMEQADLHEALFEYLQLEQFVVLAHDYGDSVAQELLARQNQGYGIGHWQAVCLLNGGLFPETHRARFIQKLLISPFGPIVNRFVNKRRFQRSLKAIFGRKTKPRANELDSFWYLVQYGGGDKLFYKLINYMTERKIHRERWLNALKDSKVPIALLNGSQDPVSGAHMVARYQELLGPPAMLVALPLIGHYPQVEAPEEIAQHFLAFIKPLYRSGNVVNYTVLDIPEPFS